jgi:hypothetical protein
LGLAMLACLFRVRGVLASDFLLSSTMANPTRGGEATNPKAGSDFW